MSDPSASKSADKKSEDANGAGPSNTTENAAAKPALEQLGALEEDDEFEVGDGTFRRMYHGGVADVRIYRDNRNSQLKVSAS